MPKTTSKELEKHRESEENNKVWTGKDGVVYVEVVKVSTEKEVVELVEKVKEIIIGRGKKAKILIEIKTSTIIRSSQFRKRLTEKLRDIIEGPGFKKAAIFGGNIVSRTIASFVIVAGGIKNMRIFGTKEEALRWLNQS